MKVTIIRHGETDSNAIKVLQGQRIDSPLNKKGIDQAKRISIVLKGEEVDAIYTSPLKRAQQTAKIIAQELSLSIIKNENLAERDFGNLTGLTWAEVYEQYGAGLEGKDKKFLYNYREFGGESVLDVKNRVGQFLNHLRNTNSQHAMCVTHSGWIRLLHHHLGVIQPKHIANCDIITVEI